MSKKYTSLESDISKILNRVSIKEDIGMGMTVPVNVAPMPTMNAPSDNNDVDDEEGSMAKVQLQAMADMATDLYRSIQDNQELEAWVQSKLAVAKDNLTGVYHYMKYKS